VASPNALHRNSTLALQPAKHCTPTHEHSESALYRQLPRKMSYKQKENVKAEEIPDLTHSSSKD
jgi:hypothetical protein